MVDLSQTRIAQTLPSNKQKAISAAAVRQLFVDVAAFIESTQTQVMQMALQVQGINQTISDTSGLQSMAAEITAVESKISAAQQAMATLNQNVTSMQASNSTGTAALQQTVNALQNSITTTAQAIAGLQQSVIDMQTALAAKQAKLTVGPAIAHLNEAGISISLLNLGQIQLLATDGAETKKTVNKILVALENAPIIQK